MFGTVARVRPKPGHEQALEDLSAEWDRERRHKAEGFIASYALRPEKDPNQVISVTIFRDRETYMRNANDPEQDAWYRRFREHLEDDPTWEDGEVLGPE